MKVAVLGAGGYIGGRLVTRLVEEGMEVRVLARSPHALHDRPWIKDVTTFAVDLPSFKNLTEALDGVEVIYYLIHSLEEEDAYFQSEIKNARALAERAAHVKQIIYMGGMPSKGGQSKHIKAKHAVGEVLAEAAPTLEIATGPVIGSGSASYEVLRDLVRRLPLLLTGPWGKTRLSVIGIDDVLTALVKGAQHRVVGEACCGLEPMPVSEIIDDIASMIRRTQRAKILPCLPWRFAAAVANLLTPVPKPVIRRLFASLPHDSVGPNELGKTLLGQPATPLPAALASAMMDDRQGLIETRWTDRENPAFDYTITETKGAYRETVSRMTHATPRELYGSILRLGGENGWGRFTFLWHLRGAIDKIVGGPGYRRGRRHPAMIRSGDPIDFWRVRLMERDARLLLEAEMKLPGEGYLVFDIKQKGAQTQITQTALFKPKGFAGWLYWWLSYPFHKFIFKDLVTRIVAHAENRTQGSFSRSSA